MKPDVETGNRVVMFLQYPWTWHTMIAISGMAWYRRLAEFGLG